MSNYLESTNLSKLRSYPTEFYFELAEWAVGSGAVTSAQRKTIKYAGNHLHVGWEPAPSKQKYILHIIKKAVNDGFRGIEGVDISEFVVNKRDIDNKSHSILTNATQLAVLAKLFLGVTCPQVAYRTSTNPNGHP